MLVHLHKHKDNINKSCRQKHKMVYISMKKNMISKHTKTQVHKNYIYIYISVSTHEQVSYPNPNDELCGHSHH